MKLLNKTILIVAFLVIGFFSYASFAEAASRFWVGGTGTWDASDTSHWAATTGGSSGASVPGASDTVTLDGSSGGGTVTVSATVTVTSITMGAFTGTLDLNGQTIDVSTFSLTGTGTRTLTMGASAINVSGAGTAWSAGTLTNCTISSNTATVTMSGAGVNFQSAGSTNWNGLSIVFSGSGQATITSDAGTYANITRTGTATKTDTFVISRMTITGTLTLAGNSASNRLLVLSNSFGTARTITNTGATMTWSNVDFRDVDLSTAYDCSGITGGCGNAGGNTDITFTTGQTNYWVGNSGNWSDVNEWANSSGGSAGTGRVPLPQDNVVFDDNSFSGAQTVTGDMPRDGTNIDWSAYTEAQSPVWAGGGIVHTIYGSVTLSSGMADSVARNTTYEGRGSHTLTSAGKTYTAVQTFTPVGGTYTLQDSYATSNTVTFTPVSSGTFNANNFNVTGTTFTATGAVTRTITMGSGTWTFTGTANAWNVNSATNLTINENTSTIVLSNTTATSKSFLGNGDTYNNLTITGSNVTLTGSNTFNNLALNNSAGVGGTRFTTGTTQTLTTFETDGSVGALVYASSTAASTATLTKAGGGTICEDYMHLTWLTGSPADTWYAGANSTDGGNTSGFTFTACPAGGAKTPSVIFKGNVLLKGNTLLK